MSAKKTSKKRGPNEAAKKRVDAFFGGSAKSVTGADLKAVRGSEKRVKAFFNGGSSRISGDDLRASPPAKKKTSYKGKRKM